ncbi:hypothetical protein AAG570_012211 [Ranatra chinensis]|uniref:Uncharacterized protein n=1 Tax=Ranatra chinensis TaxID=642074 RepID=A0ABD0YI57_9HEMI
MSAAAAARRLDALFRDAKSDRAAPPHLGRRFSRDLASEIVEVVHTFDKKCDVHGRRGSVQTTVVRRGSVDSLAGGGAPPPAACLRRRDSLVLGSPVPRETPLPHPSAFPSTLRRDSLTAATPRRDSLSKRRFSTDSLDSFRRNSWDTGRRGSSSSSGTYDETILEDILSEKSKVEIYYSNHSFSTYLIMRRLNFVLWLCQLISSGYFSLRVGG